MFAITAQRFFLSVLFLFSCCLRANEPPRIGDPETATQRGFDGHVKSVRVETSDSDGSPPTIDSSIKFDRSGRLLEDAHAYSVGGSSPTRVKYQVFRFIYGSQGRYVKIDMFSVDSLQHRARQDDLQYATYKYDSQARCVESATVDTDGETDGLTTYEYDSRGDLIRQTEYESPGKVSSMEDMKYSDDHKLLFQAARKPGPNSGPPLEYEWCREYKYDAQGNRTDMFAYRKGILEAHWISTYDERNRLVTSQTIVANEVKEPNTYGFCGDCGLSSGTATYKYDSQDRLIEERAFQPGDNLVSLDRYAYDSRGSKTQEWAYKFNSSERKAQTTLKVDGVEYGVTWTNGLPTSAYSYDSHGNWIRKLVRLGASSQEVKPRISSVTYRIIEYY